MNTEKCIKIVLKGLYVAGTGMGWRVILQETHTKEILK
jgi:hypothetical protein